MKELKEGMTANTKGLKQEMKELKDEMSPNSRELEAGQRAMMSAMRRKVGWDHVAVGLGVFILSRCIK